MGLCDGRVAIVTGAARGIGREHALSLAGHGAKVVVNDLGGDVDGSGGDLSPAEQVVAEITAAGGEAVANGDDISTWEGAQRLVNTAVEHFGDLHVLVNNAGILRDRMLTNMTEGLGPAPETDEEREMRSPRWIAPIVTWLASTESKGVTGRVFEASGQGLAVAEGWHRGPGHAPVDDPTQLGPVVGELLVEARINAGMDGKDGTWPQPAAK